MDTLHGFWDSLKSFKLFFGILFEFHDGSQVITSVAIVGDTPYSDQIFILEPKLIPLLN